MKTRSAYLLFYGNDFFEAIVGHPANVGLSYLRALWQYWNHTHGQGLPDDDTYLRRLCRCDAAEWPQVRAIVFDSREYFKLENGLWHQARSWSELKTP